MKLPDYISSSKTPEWSTPPELFRSLDQEFGPFDLDPCATPENAKCARFFTLEQDGLKQEWNGRVFINPPYGRQIGAWVRKAASSVRSRGGGGAGLRHAPARAHRHGLVVGLVHTRPDPLHPGPAQVWRLQELGAFPQRHRHLQVSA